jgi:hypothetical protein
LPEITFPSSGHPKRSQKSYTPTQPSSPWDKKKKNLPNTNKPQKPHQIIPKLFGPLRERYADRPGGYTRVLRIEPKQKFEYYSVPQGDKSAIPERKPCDQAPSAILELVDGPKDMRFAMTARTVLRQREGWSGQLNNITKLNVEKVTRFRKGGAEALEEAIRKLQVGDKKGAAKIVQEQEELAESEDKAAAEEALRSEKQAAELAKKVENLKV